MKYDAGLTYTIIVSNSAYNSLLNACEITWICPHALFNLSFADDPNLIITGDDAIALYVVTTMNSEMIYTIVCLSEEQ